MLVSKKIKEEAKELIELKNVSKKYGNFVAVDNINFNIEEEEIIGLLGPNGAGKSTIMNMITGFIEPTQGEVIIDGYDILKNSNKAKANIGYMPEGVPLYNDLTVKEFICYMADLKMVPKIEKKKRVEEIIIKTNLTDVKNKLIRNLSRGYKQRVSLAGALVSDPKILILDEPTVGLDPKQITEIRELIKLLGKKHTIILSSHILSEVSQICKKVIIINKGKIVDIDTPKNLENKTNRDNVIKIVIEDSNNNIEKLTKTISGIKEIHFVKCNEDKTKEYTIITEEKTDIRKELFKKCSKEQMTILELKKIENSLEDAFMELIWDKQEEDK